MYLRLSLSTSKPVASSTAGPLVTPLVVMPMRSITQLPLGTFQLIVPSDCSLSVRSTTLAVSMACSFRFFRLFMFITAVPRLDSPENVGATNAVSLETA